MDPIRNPYAPGAGTPPPELAGRDELRRQVDIALQRTVAGLSAKSVLMIGLRGVGKTVLLERLREDAESIGIQTMRIEAPESRSLPGMLVPELRRALIQLSRSARARSAAERALRVLAAFVSAVKLKYQDVQVGLDIEPERGTADNGDLESDLQQLLEVVGEAARAGQTAIALFIDELQYVEEDELAALITALHRAAQLSLPVVLVGAGLPQLTGQMGKAKSYAERLFEFPVIGPLSPADTELALVNPARQAGAEFTREALDQTIAATRGYPYFIQEWGKHLWNAADSSPITAEHFQQATRLVTAALDASFFRVRFDRLTPSERRYLRAMSELGEGPHRSGDIADEMAKRVSSLGPVRSSLIAKGMIYSPSHGDTAFTVPLFDQYMRRIMPGDEWRQ